MVSSREGSAVSVTIGIKARNEERHIAAAVSSAVAAAAPFNGEVILADSGSTDRTVEIAKQFPIRIVSFANMDDRCVGACAQLAFQHVTSDYFYLLDGDMVLDPGFLKPAIEYLEAHPRVAGVGGRVREVHAVNPQFQIRAKAKETVRHWQPGIVDRLDCGGLYRSAAIRDVGHFSDRNLRGFEEFDLAARLQSRGWQLARIDHHGVDHYGKVAGGYKLLWRSVQSDGCSYGTGEVLRAALGRPHLRVVVRRLEHIRNSFAVILWWALLIATMLVPGWRLAWIPLLIGPLLLLALRRRSLRLGFFSLVSWNVGAWGLLTGFFARRVPPDQPIRSVELASARPQRDAPRVTAARG
jgi:glycosyltransferase involved in cell wall biosynthesis